MPTSDTTEAGLETLIVRSLVGVSTDATTAGGTGREHQPIYAGGGYVEGDPRDYDRDHGVDLAKLLDLVRATQPEVVEQFDLENDGPERLKFLNRLQGEVAIRGVVDVLRKGVSHGPLHVDLFYGAPTPGNVAAADRYAANIFSVTRQLRYSKGGTRLALDLALFAVDDQEVWFCTHLKGRASWFLPFNKGYDDGAGNPPNPSGLKTDYLWKIVVTDRRVLDRQIQDTIKQFAQVSSIVAAVTEGSGQLRRFIEQRRSSFRRSRGSRSFWANSVIPTATGTFHGHVLAKRKVGGEARAMVVTGSIERAILATTRSCSTRCTWTSRSRM